MDKQMNHENYAIAKQIHEECKKIVAAMDARKIKDIRITCKDKAIEEKFNKQEYKKKLAETLGLEQ